MEKVVKVLLKSGLQARPAAQFVQEANRFAADIFVEKDGKQVNAKSIMGIMSIAIYSGSEIKIIAEGKDEEQAIKKLSDFVSREE